MPPLASTSLTLPPHLALQLKNPDADLRFMALNDLNAEARQPGFSLDDPTEHQLVDQVLALVTDANGEVKSVAVKTRVPPSQPVSALIWTGLDWTGLDC